jgi:hypothetical protein
MDIKDGTTVSSLKQEIRALTKEKAELLTSAKDRRKVEGIRKKIKLFKRLTRAEAEAAPAAEPAAPASPAAG